MTQKKAIKGLRVVYPLWMIAGIFSIIYVPSQIIADNAEQTARNILEHAWLFKFGIVSSLLTQLLFIFAVIMLYHLFIKVNKQCPLNMLIFALVSVPIAMTSVLGSILALSLASRNATLAMLFLDFNTQGIVIATIFWGLWLFPLGNLIRLSGYFPKAIGALVQIAGAGYFFSAFTQLLFENSGAIIPVFEVMTLGELVFIFWLLFKGAKLPKEHP